MTRFWTASTEWIIRSLSFDQKEPPCDQPAAPHPPAHEGLEAQPSADADYRTFFEQAPCFNPNSALIKGAVCGIRVEEIEDPLTRKIRYLDKLIDELAKGKPMDKILRKA